MGAIVRLHNSYWRFPAMQYFPPALENLVEHFAKLPGVGVKSAQRLAFHVLSLPEEEAAAWEERLSALGTDRNGDGRLVVRLNQYPTGGSDGDLMYAAASNVKLMADLNACESYFFLLEDPGPFQASYHVLCRLDGSRQEEGPWTAEGTYLPWNQCPSLAGMELSGYSDELPGGTAEGEAVRLVSGLYLARRGFWTEKTAAYPEGCAALWEKLTEGAVL